MCLGAYPNYVHTEFTACPLKYMMRIFMIIAMIFFVDMKLSFIFDKLSYAQYWIIYYVPMFLLFNLIGFQAIYLLYIIILEFIHRRPSWYFLALFYTIINGVSLYGFFNWSYFSKGFFILMIEAVIVISLIISILVILLVYKAIKYVSMKILFLTKRVCSCFKKLWNKIFSKSNKSK